MYRRNCDLNVALIVLVLSVLTSVASVRAVDFIDNFDTPHDYASGNVSGTIWDGVLFNSGYVGTQNAVMYSADASLSNAGRLTISTSDGGWEGVQDDGFALYRTVAGDFVATVHVTSATTLPNHDLGLMARAANSSDAGNGEDYVMLRYFAAGGFMATRSVDNDVESNVNLASGLRPYLKLERTGNLFNFTMANDSAFTASVLTSTTLRNDMDGLPLQIGIWSATFNSTIGTATFDDFKLTVVPEPSGLILGISGVVILAILTRRPMNQKLQAENGSIS